MADILAVARVLLAVAPAARAGLLQRILFRAHAAHRISRRLGRAHCDWGSGSLGELAARMPQRREPFASDPDHLAVLELVIGALRRRSVHRKVKPVAGAVDGERAVLDSGPETEER